MKYIKARKWISSAVKRKIGRVCWKMTKSDRTLLTIKQKQSKKVKEIIEKQGGLGIFSHAHHSSSLKNLNWKKKNHTFWTKHLCYGSIKGKDSKTDINFYLTLILLTGLYYELKAYKRFKHINFWLLKLKNTLKISWSSTSERNTI